MINSDKFTELELKFILQSIKLGKFCWSRSIKNQLLGKVALFLNKSLQEEKTANELLQKIASLTEEQAVYIVDNFLALLTKENEFQCDELIDIIKFMPDN